MPVDRGIQGIGIRWQVYRGKGKYPRKKTLMSAGSGRDRIGDIHRVRRIRIYPSRGHPDLGGKLCAET